MVVLGFKLQLIINDKGDNFMFIQGNVDDCEPLKQENFLGIIKVNYEQTRDILLGLCSRIFILMVYNMSLMLKVV